MDQSVLGGLIGFADNIRVMAWLGLGLSLAAFALAVAVIGRGATRVRWAGWGVLLAGAVLSLWAGVIYWLGSLAASPASGDVASTIRRFGAGLVAPMWPVGIGLAVAGALMVAGGWANLVAVILRRRREA